MLKALAKKLQRGGAGLAAALLLVAAPAQAAVFQGDWDPAFGSAFPDLGWRGEATFFVPDACLGIDGWVFNFASCSMSGMQLLGAEVDFYKLSDPNNPAFQETLLYDVPSSAVLAVKIQDGLLQGVLGAFDYARSSTLSIAGAPYTDFFLFFQDDIARLKFYTDLPYGKDRFGFSDIVASDGSSPFITFRQVPEPGALALVLLGIALLAVQSSRRGRSR